MGQVVISLAAMFASLALLIAGTALLSTVLAVQLASEGYSSLVVGLVLVCHSIGFVVGTRFATKVIRRVGQIRSFAAFAAIGCVAALIHPMFIAGWLWALLRGLVGFCAAGLIMVLESWISGRATHTTRGALLGIYQVVYFFAAASGQYLVSLGDTADYPVYSLVAMLIVLSLVPLSLTRSEAPVMGVADRLGFKQLYDLSPSGLFGAIAAGIVIAGFLALAPVYASEIGMSLADVSRYMSFAVIATMLLQWPVGRLSDIFDRRRLLTILTVIAMLGAAVAALFGSRYPILLYAATVPVFGIAGCLYPISLSMINDNMETGDPVAASAGLLFVYGIGTCIGPVAAAVAMQMVGPYGLFAFMTVVFAVYATLVAWRRRHTPDLPIEEQGRYVNIVATQTGPNILDLDPRSDSYHEYGDEQDDDDSEDDALYRRYVAGESDADGPDDGDDSPPRQP